MGSELYIPRGGPEREALRERGQFWTPDWVAEAMVAYVLLGGSETVFDPAVGAGAFFRAAQRLGRELGRTVKCLGTEVDPQVLEAALTSGLSAEAIERVELRDFVLDPPPGPFRAIVANPPYIRHHRLLQESKKKLRVLGRQIIGRALDGRAGLHVYFLLRALERLDRTAGRLAFIVPADTCEGVFAPGLWRWIASRYRIDAVITFSAEASPFPGVDINPVVLLIRSGPPGPELYWAQCKTRGGDGLRRWILTAFQGETSQELMVERRDLTEALDTGLSRSPDRADNPGPRLLDFATVLRGIATGANDFFFLTRRRAQELGIPAAFLRPAIGRTRDVPGDQVGKDLLDCLEALGRPTLLFCPDGRPIEAFPPQVGKYLAEGERRGLPHRPLIASRRPWYKMENRTPPPFLFAYLGRRNARFIRNLAGVVPLTGFLCVYPRSQEPAFVDALWELLRDPVTLGNLWLVGKSYGAGCIKVEPRALERLPLPRNSATDLLQRLGRSHCQPELPLGHTAEETPVIERTCVSAAE